MRVEEHDSFVAKSVDVRRRHFCFFVVDLEVANAEIVGIEKNHIWYSTLCETRKCVKAC